MAPGASSSPARRRRHRSRSRRHHHRRRHEHHSQDAPPVRREDHTEGPSFWPRPQDELPPNHWRGPPEGWHGSAGGAAAAATQAGAPAVVGPQPGAPPPHWLPPFDHHRGPPPPLVGPPPGGPPPPGTWPYGHVPAPAAPEYRYEAARDPPYGGGAVYGAVPPPPGLEEPVRRPARRSPRRRNVVRQEEANPSAPCAERAAVEERVPIAENRVLMACPDEQRRFDEAKRRKEEVTARKAALLGNLTEQIKVIMLKLQAEDLPEAKRAAYRNLLQQLKTKMDGLVSAPAAEETGGVPGPAVASKWVPGTARLTLDLRTKVVRVNLQPGWTLDRLREHVRKVGAGDEQVLEVAWETRAPALDGTGQLVSAERALVRFKERWAAEQLLNMRNDLPFFMEWCDNPPPASPSTAPQPAPVVMIPTPLPAAAETDEAEEEMVVAP